MTLSGIENAFALCDGILSGAEPEGDAAYAGLARRGVKTIISVDGAKPNVAAAKRAGLQYVHIPIGYDGISPRSQLAIELVLKYRPGPYFFHCHHGQHRGPAAAAVAAMSAGKIDVRSAVQYLKDAGTGREYGGLWKSVAEYHRSPASPDPPVLAESVEPKSLTAAMVQIDSIADNLKLCEKANWKTPAGHSDIEPAQQATLLKEAFREAARQLDVGDKKALHAALIAAEGLAENVETPLKQGNPERATAAFAIVQQTCNTCHRKHRN